MPTAAYDNAVFPRSMACPTTLLPQYWNGSTIARRLENVFPPPKCGKQSVQPSKCLDTSMNTIVPRGDSLYEQHGLWALWDPDGKPGLASRPYFFAGYMINQRTFPARCGNTLVERLCIGLRSPGCPPWRIPVKPVRHNGYSFHISYLGPWKVFRAKIFPHWNDGNLRASLSVHLTTAVVFVAVI